LAFGTAQNPLRSPADREGDRQSVHAKPVKDRSDFEPRSKAESEHPFSALMSLGVKSSARLNKNQQEDLGIIVGQRE
jgi:hypothetical protein